MSPGVGAIASGYRVVGGGGGPTTNVVEVQSGAATTNATPTIATTLLSTDRVVITVSKQSTAGVPAVSGLGATWVTDASNTSTYDLYVYSAAGITGGGTVTIALNGAGDWTLHVLRSSVAATPALVSAQVLPFAAAAAGTVRSTSGVATSAGAAVIGVARISAGTISFPTSSTPGGGWTTDYTSGTTVKAISQTISSGATVSVGVTSGALFSASLIQAIYL